MFLSVQKLKILAGILELNTKLRLIGLRHDVYLCLTILRQSNYKYLCENKPRALHSLHIGQGDHSLARL